MNQVNNVQQGTLKCGQSYTIKHLTLTHLEQILLLQNNCRNELDYSPFLQPLTKEEYHFILNGHGLIVGCFVKSRLIAFRALLAPKIDETHLGLETGLEMSELNQVIYQEISIVDQTFQGNRLQQKLGLIAMKQLHDQYKYVCATVAPLNIPSLLDKFRQQMVITSLKQIYDDKWRYVFFKNLLRDTKKEWAMTKAVAMDDFKRQQHLLNDGWLGYSFKKQNDEYFVLYGKNKNTLS